MDHRPEAYHQAHRAVIDAYRKRLQGDRKYFLGEFSLRSGANIYGVIFGSSWIEALPENARGTILMDGVNQMLNDGMDPEHVWKTIESFSSDDLEPFLKGRLISLASGVELEKARTLWDQLTTDHPSRAGSARSIVGSWAASDPMAAEAWARSLPDAAIRDAAMTQLVETAGRFQPEEALNGVSSIEDETLRAGAVEHTLTILSYIDPQRAPAELERFELPTANREVLEASLREQVLWQNSAPRPAL